MHDSRDCPETAVSLLRQKRLGSGSEPTKEKIKLLNRNKVCSPDKRAVGLPASLAASLQISSIKITHINYANVALNKFRRGKGREERAEPEAISFSQVNFGAALDW